MLPTRFNPCPKPSPRWMEKAKQRAEEARTLKQVYAQVDRRDGPRCRVCGARVGGVGLLERRHHHHLTYRSRGGEHTTANTLSTCVRCHQAVHDAEIRLSGDADLRDTDGKFCGVTLERYTEAGWKTERMI